MIKFEPEERQGWTAPRAIDTDNGNECSVDDAACIVLTPAGDQSRDFWPTMLADIPESFRAVYFAFVEQYPDFELMP